MKIEGKITRSKKKGKKAHTIIEGVLGIIDGFVKVISLGYYFSNFQYKFMLNNL